MASSVNPSATFSVAISAMYCWTRLASGSVRMRRKSSRVSGCELDADRQAALQLRQRSDGLASGRRPRQMNRMWSVFTGPCLVATVVPSISGNRSRCTPSRLTSAPPRLRGAEILSISSRKTMPFCSTDAIASRTTRSLVEELVGPSAISTSWNRDRHLADSWCGCRKPCPASRRYSPCRPCAPGMPGFRISACGRPASRTSTSISLSFELAVTQLCTKRARVSGWRWPHQSVQHALLGGELGLGLHLLAQPLARHVDGHLDQVADRSARHRGRHSRPR